jgi:serine/threonine protein kinase
MDSDSELSRVVGERYELVRLLGSGASGAVYEGRDRKHRERVAIKLLHPYLLDSDGAVARFFREIRAAQELQHPGVVEFRASGLTDDGRPYLVQEFLHGQDMQQALESEALTLPDVFEISQQLLDSLAAIHDVGLVHRDVKPENLYLLHDEFGGLRTKLVDFGLVKPRQGTVQQLTGVGTAVGTPYYMSPEQAQGADVDARADLWSVGVLLFEALTGTFPFDHENPLVLLTQIVMHPAPSVTTRRPDLPPGLAGVIDRALTRNLADRWQSARGMARALRESVGLK